MTRTTAHMARGLVATALVIGSVACLGSELPTIPEGRTVLVRNLRADTIVTVYMPRCDEESEALADSLGPREKILPGGNRSFALSDGCFDMQFMSDSTSIVDARFRIRLERGDSLLVLLRSSD